MIPVRDVLTPVVARVIRDAPLSAEKVALCMVALKISRELNSHKRDNLVDMAGYAGTIELIRKRTEK